MHMRGLPQLGTYLPHRGRQRCEHMLLQAGA